MVFCVLVLWLVLCVLEDPPRRGTSWNCTPPPPLRGPKGPPPNHSTR